MTDMKKLWRKTFSFVLIMALVCLATAMIIPAAAAASAVDLGTAGDYAILSKSGITTTGATAVTGDMGVSPIDSTAITGFGLTIDPSGTFSTSSLVVGKIYAADYTNPTPARLTTAVIDMEGAYTDAAGRAPDYTELHSGNLGGKILTPGVYKYTTGVTIPDDLTLDAQGDSTSVWIFQIAQNLDIAVNKQVILSNGADATNIFWQVAGTTTLYADSVFQGNVLGASTIALLADATLNGRMLGQKEVTLIANSVTGPINRYVSDVVVNGTQTIQIPGSGQSAVTENYTATVLDQFGNAMPGEDVTWTLQAPVAGVSIDAVTGNVTIANADTTGAGSFTVVATSTTDGDVSGTLEVILSVPDVPLVVTQVTMTGTQAILIPESGQSAVTENYTATVLDQFGNAMPGEDVTWTLQAPVAGVSIDAVTGNVTIANADTTGAGSFTVVATSTTDGDVSGTLEVILSVPDVPLVVTQVTMTGTQTIPIPESGQAAVTENYTATVLDQFGNAMPGEDVTWSLQTPVAGVSIDAVTGIVTIANADTTGAGSFTVVATSTTDGDVSGTLEVILSDIPIDVPVPEFPTMMIPVFLVGSLLVATRVLKKE